jgi:hypothetical protein
MPWWAVVGGLIRAVQVYAGLTLVNKVGARAVRRLYRECRPHHLTAHRPMQRQCALRDSFNSGNSFARIRSSCADISIARRYSFLGRLGLHLFDRRRACLRDGWLRLDRGVAGAVLLAISARLDLLLTRLQSL